MNFEHKKLLILGANAETIPIVKKAMSMGIYTIVTDYIIGSPAKKIANQYFDINGKDVDELIKIINKEKIDGVLVGVAEPLVLPYIELCKKMGFPCIVEESTVTVFENKSLFRQVCKQIGLSVIEEYFLCENMEELSSNLKFPMVIKPAVSRGGKGISLSKSWEDLPKDFQKAKENSDNGKVIGEEYFSDLDVVATFIFNCGKPYLLAMSDRIMCKGKTELKTVTYSNIFPSKWTKLFVDKYLEKFCVLFDTIGVKNGIVNIQMFVRDGEFYPYDPDCIINGEHSSNICKEIYNIDILESLIEFAFSGKLDIKFGTGQGKTYLQKVGASVWILLRPGRIETIIGRNEVENMECIIGSVWRLNVGDIVTEAMYQTEKATLARIWVKAKDKVELQKNINTIRRAIKVVDIYGNDMMEREV